MASSAVSPYTHSALLIKKLPTSRFYHSHKIRLSSLTGYPETLPNIEPLLKPSTLGDVATYLFFSAGGLFIGGELGLLAGSFSAGRTISQDPESSTRIETAFSKLRADVLRKEADSLDGGASVIDKLF